MRVRADLSVEPGSRFGIVFKAANSGRLSQISVDTALGSASFQYNGETSDAPHVAFPPSVDGSYTIDLVIDPELGLGVAYINDFRALSFRYYRVGGATLSMVADTGFRALSGTVAFRSIDQAEE
ncbi:MAG: hypothetical protein KIT02_13580 [Devosia sp.]|uniref:hypothetical protein n=1 Tax=Devosia sp. TaxID=1871048 RepID=UPI0024C55D1C|nr:hypothetical protein [Devosia sp.]UYN98953.1 MAG: hypothetical protein KIT02_13580 [Devosia sp.]